MWKILHGHPTRYKTTRRSERGMLTHISHTLPIWHIYRVSVAVIPDQNRVNRSNIVNYIGLWEIHYNMEMTDCCINYPRSEKIETCTVTCLRLFLLKQSACFTWIIPSLSICFTSLATLVLRALYHISSILQMHCAIGHVSSCFKIPRIKHWWHIIKPWIIWGYRWQVPEVNTGNVIGRDLTRTRKW